MSMTKRIALAILTCLALLGLLCASVAEQTPVPPASNKRDNHAPITSRVLYKPPDRGAPGGRVGGGTRGTTPGIYLLSVLTPDHTALTLVEQPSLFWFISDQTSLPVEITIVDPRSAAPLARTTLPSPVARGIHRVRLSDMQVRLSVGIAYQWSVSVIANPERRSKDIVSTGTIERVSPDAVLASKLAAAGKDERAAVYAQAGIWYDALETLCDMIDASPDDKTLRRERDALLMQGELSDVSE